MGTSVVKSTTKVKLKKKRKYSCFLGPKYVINWGYSGEVTF